MTAADQTLVARLVSLLKDFTQDWDSVLDGEYGRDTRLLADLGFESVDIIQLTVAVEEEFGLHKTPFDRLLMKDGRYVDDLSVGQLADFLAGFVKTA
ncbi:MAG: phosphopantetheine-binding protein [Gammaproteobacteria bacterium]